MTTQIWNLLHIAATLLLAGVAAYAFSKDKARRKNEERLLLENEELRQENEMLRQEVADYEESILPPP